MAHELETVNGKASMFFVGSEGAPWHALGQSVTGALTASEAITTAGLDYEVETCPCYTDLPDGTRELLPTVYTTVRKDTNTVLGVVSDRYRPVNNHEAFSFLDEVAQGGDVMYHTAGVFGIGERIWMLAKLPGIIQVGGSDTVEKFLLLYNSHDGTSALRCFWTPVRVVCFNTCSAALRQGEGTGISIKHTGDIKAKVKEAQRALGLAHKYFQAYEEGAAMMAGYRPESAEVDQYFRFLFPDPEGKDAGRAKEKRSALWGLFRTGIGQDQPAIEGTAWAAYNAITESVDHHAKASASSRLENSWTGDGAKIKREAWDAGIKLAAGAFTA